MTIDQVPPKPYCSCKDKSLIKAFILGCDPTAFSDEGELLQFNYVFDIGGDSRYFSGINRNLKLLNLSLNDIYVQNLITEYQKTETAENTEWMKVARESISMRKEEFHSIDPEGSIPVFLTSSYLYETLLKSGLVKLSPKQIYECIEIPIQASNNYLERPLIPLFRHYKYNLKQWPKYLSAIKTILQIPKQLQ